ncbi:hypothetical protein WICPIJ_001136 [Wickerhamomyces pijperi]|uniref:U6 snRNA-associated Sm-like protein LSm1 n=1 Tax=Wickerhamomyces pijperi TaxID=599730 RepID=A0A9P8QC86_WICPI|nr:hypothetical protein WICPIJ_001136 [Wickerhamomyces pijperi]
MSDTSPQQTAAGPPQQTKSNSSSKDPVDSLASNVQELYLESFSFTTAAAIIGYVDRKICATLTDGRHLFGVLRTFDQYGSVVIQDTTERIYGHNSTTFAEKYLGTLLIRGENLLMLGDVDIDREDAPLEKLQRIDSFKQAEQENKQWLKEAKLENKLKSKKLFEYGQVNENFITY